MPLYVVACTNIKQLTNEQINMLRCGDWIVKKTGNQEHAYKVTYKSPTGICLTYMDASVIETQSYDLVDGNWVYNSEDKTPVAEPLMENIVDANGYNRFVSGDITAITISGVEQTYGRWSLSGTHLLVVCCYSIENSTFLSQSKLCDIELPDFIKDKINPVVQNLIDAKTFNAYNSDYTSQNLSTNLVKTIDGLKIEASMTATKDRNVRVVFDLLIDAD